jgi:crotonobetainyl-CoA:carnitine CoA-transferase CaiB-like acyl-CoA transferase
LLAAVGILAALHARERTGVGQRVETSLLEAMVYQLTYEVAIYTISGLVPQRMGSRNPLLVPYGIFKTEDDYVAVAAVLRFPELCRAIGRPELAEDPRFARLELQVLNQYQLYPVLEEVFVTRTTEEWLRTLEAADIPCAPVNTIDKVLVDPQVLDRDMVVDVQHANGGTVKLVGNPVKMSATPPDASRQFTTPPLLGQHTEEVLMGILHYSQGQIADLRGEEAIG